MKPSSAPLPPATPARPDDDALLQGALAAALRPLPMPAGAAPRLRRRLLDRVQASALRHRPYVTVRREQGAWLPEGQGCERRSLWQGLWQDARVDVSLWRLDAGVALPWLEGATAQELLVVGGTLVAPAVGELAANDHVQQLRASALPLAAGSGGAMVYARQVLDPLHALPPLEQRWWAPVQACPHMARAASGRWISAASDVQVLRLAGDDRVASTLLRCRAGSRVPDHGHGLHEDCLMLEGEMYLGDILLREGDYQLAPAGAVHFDVSSDVGSLFYIHGAIDPVLARGW